LALVALQQMVLLLELMALTHLLAHQAQLAEVWLEQEPRLEALEVQAVGEDSREAGGMVTLGHMDRALPPSVLPRPADQVLGELHWTLPPPGRMERVDGELGAAPTAEELNPALLVAGVVAVLALLE
jgi:hypothetical protein